MPSKRDISSAIVKKIEKLAQITQELYEGKNFSITRLTRLKSLCKDPDAAAHFVMYLARRIEEKMEDKEPEHIPPEKWCQHKTLAREAVFQMEKYVTEKTNEQKATLRELLWKIQHLQNTYEQHRWGPVRLIESSETLVVEEALECILSPENASFWGYYVGREYAERYNPKYGTGLLPESVPMMEDIVRFWCHYYKLELAIIGCKEG